MTSRAKHYNKNTGVTYVYESTSYWDKERQQPRNKKVCIGKLDENGEFVLSKRLRKETNEKPQQEADKELPTTASAQIVGPAMILNKVEEDLGLSSLLKSCFPDTYQQIITMAQYLVIEGGALTHCSAWCKSHAPSMADSLTSQRISEILPILNTDKKQTFLNKWMKKTAENDYLCYDITSVSSYSQINEYIKYGYNRDKENLPQLNLSILFGQHQELPVYYDRYPGSITDVKTLHNLLKTFKALDIKTLSYVLDKGFYSKNNVDDLLARKDKFLLAVPMNNKWLKSAIDAIYETIHGPEGYRQLDDEILYVDTRLYPWGEKRHRCYLHLYYNAKSRADDVDQFNKDLIVYRQELESHKRNSHHEAAYEEFFIIKTTPKRGMKVTYNNAAIRKHIGRYTGFQALLSNSIKDPVKALQVYRDKDVVEKSFDDLKNQLDMKRLRMHNSRTTDGRLFVQFIALIYMSALRREMRKTDLIKHYNIREILKEMEPLTKITYSGKYGHILTESTKTQKYIMKLLGMSEDGKNIGIKQPGD